MYTITEDILLGNEGETFQETVSNVIRLLKNHVAAGRKDHKIGKQKHKAIKQEISSLEDLLKDNSPAEETATTKQIKDICNNIPHYQESTPPESYRLTPCQIKALDKYKKFENANAAISVFLDEYYDRWYDMSDASKWIKAVEMWNNTIALCKSLTGLNTLT